MSSNNNSEKEAIAKRKARFNYGKIKEKLQILKDTVSGNGLDIRAFTGTVSESGRFTYKEDLTRAFVNELTDYIGHYEMVRSLKLSGMYKYSADFQELKRIYEREKSEYSDTTPVSDESIFEKMPPAKGAIDELPENEMIFFKSLLYCSVRITLYEAKKNDTIPTFNSILQCIRSLEPVYRAPGYTAYEAFFNEPDLTVDPTDTILDHTYGMQNNGDALEIINSRELGLRSIFDKINIYYWYLTEGHLPVNADIEGYKKTDPEHFRLLNNRHKAVLAERKAAETVQKAWDEKVMASIDEESEYYESIDLDANSFSNEEQLQNGAEDDFSSAPNFKRFKDFRKADAFIRECELFRFYLKAVPPMYESENKNEVIYTHNLPGYAEYIEKAEYAIEKYITENDLCGFSDTDTSVYIYTLLQEAADIVEEKREEKMI